MTWGPCFMYYKCPKCGKQFKYAIDMITAFGEDFGKCPSCGYMGALQGEGARKADDLCYEEVE